MTTGNVVVRSAGTPSTVAGPGRVSRARRATRRQLHRLMTARRGIFVKVHRWLSFTVMIWILLESVTGAAIVFDHEIDRWWNSEHFAVTEGDVGLDAALAAMKEARPSEPVASIWTPGSDVSGDAYGAYFTAPAEREGDDAVTRLALVDPGTGNVLTADHRPPELLRILSALHFNLNSSSVFGLAGVIAIGWLALVWLVVLLSGFYVWYWPGAKRWANATRVRRGRGRFTFQLDLHKAVGLLSFVPLVAVTVTGINFAFPSQVEDVVEIVTFGSYDPPSDALPLSQTRPGAKPIGEEAAMDIATALDTSIKVHYIDPTGGSSVATYGVVAEVDSAFLGMVGGQRDIEVAVDQYTGHVVSIEDHALDNFATRAYHEWFYPVHTGEFGGLTTRLLWVVLGLLPAVLAWSGTTMWLVRLKKRRRRAHRSSTPLSPGPQTEIETEPQPEMP